MNLDLMNSETVVVLRALESGTVILEMKDGAYEPIGSEDVMDVFKRESLQGK